MTGPSPPPNKRKATIMDRVIVTPNGTRICPHDRYLYLIDKWACCEYNGWWAWMTNEYDVVETQHIGAKDHDDVFDDTGDRTFRIPLRDTNYVDLRFYPSGNSNKQPFHMSGLCLSVGDFQRYTLCLTGISEYLADEMDQHLIAMAQKTKAAK